MNSPFRLLTLCSRSLMWLGLCVSAFIANNVAGQTASAPNNATAKLEDIYRIEMVVFANNNSYTDEQWPARPVLRYPSQLLFLDEMATPDAALTQNTAEPALATDTVAETTSEPSDSVASNTVNLPPLLRKLPREERVLNESATALDRRNAYRVLFHEAWLQQLEAPIDASALVINGGRAFDDHFALEGSVTFSKKRFLHINTNLWLNKFDTLPHNTGQDSWQHYYADTVTLPLVPTAKVELMSNNPEFNNEVDTQLTGNLSESPEASASSFANNKQANLQNNFIVKHAYTLKEYRRLKRDEVHYLDHPRFGLIVTISKYEPKLEDSE